MLISQELSLDVQVITTQTVSHPDSQSDMSFAKKMKGKYPSVFDENRNFLIKTNEEFQTQLEVGDELDTKSNINKNLNNSNVNDNHVPDNDIINGDNTTPITSKINGQNKVTEELSKEHSSKKQIPNLNINAEFSEQSSGKQILRKSNRVKQIPTWTKDYNMNVVKVNSFFFHNKILISFVFTRKGEM